MCRRLKVRDEIVTIVFWGRHLNQGIQPHLEAINTIMSNPFEFSPQRAVLSTPAADTLQWSRSDCCFWKDTQESLYPD